MPLDREVDLGPDDIVLYGDPAPPTPKEKGHSPPALFGPCLLWPSGWMDQDATCYEGKSRLRPHRVRWGSSSSPIKGGTAPIFGSCLLWQSGRPYQLLLSTCCTADGGEILSFTTGRYQTSAYKLPVDVGVSGSRLIHGFLGHTGVHIP